MEGFVLIFNAQLNHVYIYDSTVCLNTAAEKCNDYVS